MGAYYSVAYPLEDRMNEDNNPAVSETTEEANLMSANKVVRRTLLDRISKDPYLSQELTLEQFRQEGLTVKNRSTVAEALKYCNQQRNNMKNNKGSGV